MLASLFNVCEDRVIPHIFAEFLIFIALSSKERVMTQISSLVSVIVLSIVFCPLGVGRGASPVGALPPYPQQFYLLISYTQSLTIVFRPNASASSLVSNCLTIPGESFGSIGSCTNIYFFIALQFTSYLSEINSFLWSEVDAVSTFLAACNLMQDIFKHPQLVKR